MFLLLAVVTLGFHSVHGLVDIGGTRYWNQTTNFFNEKNWRRHELPCASDRIIFPKTVPLISVLKNVEISQFIMPLNGDILFGPDVKMAAVPTSQLHKPSCPGKDRKFTRNRPLSWFDPANWCEKLDDGRCVRAAIDAAAVPAQFDSAIFPTGTNTFFVNIDYDESITVGKLNFRLKWQTTHDFRLFASSQDGQKEFVNTESHLVPTVTIAKAGCSDARGCVPDTLKSKLFKKICSKVTCGKAKCEKPMKVTGACCPFCGSTVLARINSAFTFTTFARQIRTLLRKHVSVLFSVMRTDEDSVQVALTDDEGGEFVEKTLPDVKDMLRSRQEKMGLVSYSVKSSKGPRPNPQSRTGMKGSSKTAIIIFVIILIAVVCFVGAALLYQKARSGQLTLPSIPFRPRTPNLFRFSWSRRAEETAGSAGVVQMELTSPGLSIQNPVYRGPEISVTPLDDSYDQPLSVSSILTNPAFVSSKSDEEEGECKKEARTTKEESKEAAPEELGAAASSGTLTVEGHRKLEVTNLAFRTDEEEDASEA